MTNIRLEFPASRYHATPWGRHVNEGVAEWPPSPYRLLRALFDVWQRKCDQLPESAVADVLGALAGSEPVFSLPAASAAHTRSYVSANSEDPTDKSLVFDAFLAFDKTAACSMQWRRLRLTAQQRSVLAELLANLNYLGRSESWVRASLGEEPEEQTWQCVPVDAANYAGEVLPVACVVPPKEYSGKKSWIEALTTSSSDVLKQRTSGPPLLRYVRYLLPGNAIQTDPAAKPRRKEPDARAVLLGLDATVLPLATATIEVAEQIRVRLMGAHRRRMDDDASKVSDLFSGKTADGTKRLDHGHVYVLPLFNERGRIDRVLLVSRLRAFRQDELDAVRGVRELYQADDRPKVRCVVAWQGAIGHEPIWQPSDRVVSATPFVTARHWRRGRDMEAFLRDEVRRECRNHGIPEPVAVERIDRPAGLFECVEYRRNRKDDPSRAGYAFRMSFAEPIPTPFSLGYGAHFGLGQFRPED